MAIGQLIPTGGLLRLILEISVQIVEGKQIARPGKDHHVELARLFEDAIGVHLAPGSVTKRDDDRRAIGTARRLDPTGDAMEGLARLLEIGVQAHQVAATGQQQPEKNGKQQAPDAGPVAGGRRAPVALQARQPSAGVQRRKPPPVDPTNLAA